MCGPLCPIGLVGGMALARWLGVSDLVLGLWIGALIVSATVVTVKWLAKYGKDFKGSFATILLLTVAITAFSVRKQLAWHGPGLVLGLPPVVAGIALGAAAIFVIDAANKRIIASHDGKVYFPYQRLVAPLVGILATSLVVHFFFS